MEEEKKHSIVIDITKEQKEKIDKIVNNTGMSEKEIMQRIIDKFLNQNIY